MKHLKRKKNRSPTTTHIVYRDHRHPHDRPQQITTDAHRPDLIDMGYAAAVVAVRTSIPLNQATIIKIVGPEEVTKGQNYRGE